VHSKKLPAPLSLKQHNNFDIAFARNSYAGVDTSIGLNSDERARHMYILGATGSGKSTLLLSMIEQDIKNGKTICVIDPHGDLALSALDCVPPSRIQDVVYFNPFDIAYPIGINLLQTTPELREDEKLLEQEFVTESVVSLFRKVFSEGSTGHPHRIEYILRNTIHTAFTVENPTLFTIFDLLNDPGYQKEVVSKLTDEHLLNFWKYEFGKAGDYQKVKMVSPVTARIGRFLFSPSARRVLEQKESTINFDKLLEENKIFICNLSKGNIGEDTSEVMGVMILNKLQLALLKRARKEQTQRKQFYLYVDEFQNFATPSFVQMLSESRKYGLHLTIAEQSTSQQNDRNMVHTILANVGNVVAFRSANPQDEDLLLRQFSPYIQRGDIANLPAFNFYMKISALTPEEPFSGETVVPDLSVDYDKREAIVNTSRQQYARFYEKAYVETKHVRKPKIKKSKNEQIPASVVVQSVFPEEI
jgi:energy-coupling factor transporter ATP-binding protein EcfA2